MTEDNRPLLSPAPEWAKELSQEFTDRLRVVFEELWAKAVHASAAAVERGDCNPAEAQNDAISTFNHGAAFPLMLAAEKIVEMKAVPADVALSVALTDAKLRLSQAFDQAVEDIRTGDPFDEATFAAREWLIGQADIANAAEAAQEEANEVSERLNGRADPKHPQALHMASSLVARALLVRAIIQTAGDWLAMETGMPPDLAQAALKSIADELPPGLSGESFIAKEKVN